MKKLLFVLGIISTFAVSAFTQATPAPTPPPLTLKVGDMAPDFNLPSTAGGRVKLSDFRGKNNVVLAFFVLAFTGG
jgi:cytochrome oxidase Cu insertion factor (SCO1/SenC/PrrC family)